MQSCRGVAKAVISASPVTGPSGLLSMISEDDDLMDGKSDT